jgi:homoserine kinase
LMQVATRDVLHQPYRMQLCPLLPALLPLAGAHGVLSVTLSGAGPSVLLLTEKGGSEQGLRAAILELAKPVCPVEILTAKPSDRGTSMKVIE